MDTPRRWANIVNCTAAVVGLGGAVLAGSAIVLAIGYAYLSTAFATIGLVFTHVSAFILAGVTLASVTRLEANTSTARVTNLLGTTLVAAALSVVIGLVVGTAQAVQLYTDDTGVHSRHRDRAWSRTIPTLVHFAVSLGGVAAVAGYTWSVYRTLHAAGPAASIGLPIPA